MDHDPLVLRYTVELRTSTVLNFNFFLCRFGSIKILAPLQGRDSKFSFLLIYFNELVSFSSLFWCTGANYRKLGPAVDILLLCASIQEGRASEPTTVVNY